MTSQDVASSHPHKTKGRGCQGDLGLSRTLVCISELESCGGFGACNDGERAEPIGNSFGRKKVGSHVGQCLSQAREGLSQQGGVRGEDFGFFHLASVGFEGDAVKARDNVKMKMEHRLATRHLVELHDRNTVSGKC